MKHLAFLLLLLLTASPSAQADKGYYKHVGTGGYGISNKKMICPNCGRTISVSDTHMCRKESAPSGSSSPSGGSSGTMSASEAEAIMSKYPDLLVNQTSFTPVDMSQTGSTAASGENENENYGGNSSYEDEGYSNMASAVLHGYKRESTGSKLLRIAGYVLLWALIIGGVWFLFRRVRKFFADPKVPPVPRAANPAATAGMVAGGASAPNVNAAAEAAAVRKNLNGLSDKLHDMAGRAGEAAKNARNSEAAQRMQAAVSKGVQSARSKVRTAIDKRAARGPQTSVADELIKLNELKNAGAITEEEYQKLKADLIARK